MSATLRVLLSVSALVTVVWILRQIRKFKVKMEDAIFWTFFAGILLLLAVFPQISFAVSRLIGFMSPANFIYIVIIFLLVEKIFTLSIIVSQLEDKVSVLSAELALRAHSADKRLTKDEDGPEEYRAEQRQSEIAGIQSGSNGEKQ